MKKSIFMKRVVSFLLSFSIMLPLGQPAFANNLLLDTESILLEDTNENSEISEDINKSSEISENAKLLAGSFLDYGYVSIQYTLYDSGKVIMSDNVGVYSPYSDRAITEETMYGIGSVSKMFVTAAVMKLVDEKKVDLDKPVYNYIEDFEMNDERYKNITVRMLLNHSSGIPGTTFADFFTYGKINENSNNELLEYLKDQKLKDEPGAFSVYCNDGFTLLEILVERVSNQTFTEYLHENITKPLGLTNTKTPRDDFDREQLAKLISPYWGKETPEEVVNAIGTGGIYSTSEELCKFAEIFMYENEILSRESKNAMENEEYKNGIWPDGDGNLMAYGLGWDNVHLSPFDKYGIKVLQKGGDTSYHGTLLTVPEYNISIAVLSSGGSSTLNTALASDVLLSYLNEKNIIETIVPIEDNVPVFEEKMPEDLEKYSGLYLNKMGNDEVEVSIEDNSLKILSSPDNQYMYAGNNEFKSEDGSITLSFQEEKNSHTYLKLEQFVPMTSTIAMKSISYNAQKVKQNQLSEEVKNAWKNRNGNLYFPNNISLEDQINGPAGMLILNADLENGYVFNCKIIDESLATNVVQLPVADGRDTFDIKFAVENGIEYLRYNTLNNINEKDVKNIYSGKNSYCTISDDGYSKWFKITEDTKGKKITIEYPAGAGFSLIDSEFKWIGYTPITKDNTVELPDTGYINFIGNPGDRFNITIE